LFVMAGLLAIQDVDVRDKKPGHDEHMGQLGWKRL